MPQPRTFEDRPAVREATPLLIGLVGPSGSGKTFSALRLATGIQRVSAGEIWCIDTEARRSLHYADQFKFRHLEFKAPFSPLDYLAAIEHCANKGAKIIIVDSASHEHEGPGGVLEMHDSELDRLSLGKEGRRDNFNLLAWQKPKSERRRLLNSILQMPINFIFCFRAKDKTKPGKDAQGKSTMISLGWMPIAGEEFVYEMTVNMLLYPASGGVPMWQPQETGEKSMIKLPAQFKEILAAREPLSEEIGERLARWAAGGNPPTQTTRQAPATQPRPTSQVPAAQNGDFISEPQRKRFYAIYHQTGWTDEEVKKLLARYGIAHGNEIPKAKYQEIVSKVEAGTTGPPSPADPQPGETLPTEEPPFQLGGDISREHRDE